MKKKLKLLTLVFILFFSLISINYKADAQNSSQENTTNDILSDYKETKLVTKVPNADSLSSWSINLDSQGKVYSYIYQYETPYNPKKKIKSVCGNAVISYTRNGKAKITYLPSNTIIESTNYVKNGKLFYVLTDGEKRSYTKFKIVILNKEGKVKQNVSFNTLKLLEKNNKSNTFKYFTCNKILYAGKNKCRILYSFKNASSKLIQGGIAIFDLKTGKLKNETILDFSPMKMDSNYIYGVDGKNMDSSGKMVCMIADKQTGQIINTLPTDYATSEADKQKDIGGEFFGDYFYDFNNGKIIISNPSGIYYGKVTDKELEKISNLSDSIYYKGASEKNKYKIKEIKMKNKNEFYILYCQDADTDFDNVLVKYTAQ